MKDAKPATSRLKKLGGAFLLAVVLAAVCRNNRQRESDTNATPRTIVPRTAEVPKGAPSPEPATSERTPAEPITVRQYLVASPAEQEKALRARWVANASEPTLGKLVSAARETGAENDTVLGIKHCVDGLVRKDRKVLGAFKDLGITDAHLMQEPDRVITDAIDSCMVMMTAMAANSGS